MAQKDRTASLLVIAAGICWGIIGVFSKRLSAAGFSPVQITFGRSLVTAVVLTVMLAVKHPEKLRISWRDGWMFLGTGLCSIVFFNICYFIAIELTSLSVAAILLYTAPSIVMVLSVLLFKERFTVRKALALALAFGGQCAGQRFWVRAGNGSRDSCRHGGRLWICIVFHLREICPCNV